MATKKIAPKWTDIDQKSRKRLRGELRESARSLRHRARNERDACRWRERMVNRVNVTEWQVENSKKRARQHRAAATRLDRRADAFEALIGLIARHIDD
jgi:hypothetical protein